MIMHICTVMSTPIPPEEGIGNYVYNLSRELIEKGNEVTILTRNQSLNSCKKRIEGMEVIYAPFIKAYPFYIDIHGLFVNNIFKRLEADFDVVHLHTPLVPLIKTSLPLVTTVHTPMLIDTRYYEDGDLRGFIEGIMGRFVSYPLEKKLLRNSTLITAVANSVANELREYGLDASKVIVLGNGVNEKIFVPKREPSKEKYILFTGRLVYRKGLYDLLECSRMLYERYKDLNFIIVGKGGLSTELKEKVKNLGMEDRFKILGYVDKKALIQLYQNATIYVLPSHYEGLPTVLLEAMSCGLPVIATAVSGNLDVISTYENGILVPPKSPSAMVSAISILLEDESLRKKLGKNARRSIEERYTWDIISNNLIGYYRSISRT